MWTSSTPLPASRSCQPPFVVTSLLLESPARRPAAPRPRRPPRPARRTPGTRAGSRPARSRAPQPRHTPGRRHVLQHQRARPPTAVPCATQLERELERRGTTWRRCPTCTCTSVTRPPARVPRSRCATIGLGDRELVHRGPQQILGSGSPTSMVHHAPAAEGGLDEHHAGRLGADLADLGRLLAARHRAQRRERGRRPPPAPRTRPACPRWRRTSGRCPSSSAAPATAGSHRHVAPRARASRRRDARASSLSTEATPPRVASRMQRSAPPAASSSASTAGHSERVSDSTSASRLELAAREHDRRAVLADRARDEHAVARPQRAAATAARAGRRRPSPVVQTYIPSAWPRSTTLVSPATTATPAAAAAAAIASTSARSSSGREALLEHEREASARAAARPRPRGR